MTLKIDQTTFQSLIKLGRFCAQWKSDKFPGIEYPWTSDGYAAATDGVHLIMIKCDCLIPVSGLVPNISQFIEKVSGVSSWEKFDISYQKCRYCERLDPEEACSQCELNILGAPFYFERVMRIKDNFNVEGVALDGCGIVFKLDTGFAYLMGLKKEDSE